MSERAELAAALAEHPRGAVHLEHAVAVVGADGRPVRDEGGVRARWDYGAARMVAWCGCGWVGEPREQQKVGAGGAGAGQYEEWRRVNRAAVRWMEIEWQGHVDEVLPTVAVYEARIVLERAERGLKRAVEDARVRGASWADLGTATGLGKKTAHQRWGGNKDILLDREMSKGGRPRKPTPDVDDAAATGTPETGTPAPGRAGARNAPENGAQAGARPRGRAGRGGRGRDTGRQVRELVRALSQRHGFEVDATWEGTRSRDGRRGGWTIEWRGGPSRADLRADAALVVEEDPRLAGLDVGELSWVVGRADADDAALVLEWLRTHPGEGDRVRHLPYDELPGWPEHLPAEVRAHAATLAAAGWGYQRGGQAPNTLHAHAARGGYEAVAAWLTELAAHRDAHRDAVQDGTGQDGTGQDGTGQDGTVVDLAAHRTH